MGGRQGETGASHEHAVGDVFIHDAYLSDRCEVVELLDDGRYRLRRPTGRKTRVSANTLRKEYRKVSGGVSS